MKKNILILVSGTLMISLFGCGTMGTFRGNNITNVELSQPNFNIVAKDLEGSASQGYLFGISVPQDLDVGIIGLIKISGEDKPFAAAVKKLCDDYRDKHGDPEGKKLALINIRQDTKVVNALVYAEAKIYITADVIEFIE